MAAYGLLSFPCLDALPASVRLPHSDTVESYPVVMRVFNEETDKQTVLIRVQCGDRLTWRNPENPFHWEPFHIRSVPTLSRWNNGMLQGRSLVDYEPSVPYLIKRFINGSTSSEGSGQLEGA